MQTRLIDDLSSFIRRASFAPTLDALNAESLAILEPAGFGAPTYVTIGSAHRDVEPWPIFGASMRDWMEHYYQKDYLRHDPAVAMCLWSSSPFTWTDAEERSPTPAARAMFADARKHLAPEMVHCPVVAGGGEVAVVCIPMQERRPLLPEESLALQCIAGLYARRGNILLDRTPTPPDHPVNVPSRREGECIYWVAMGKTDGEIADIMGISPNTVHHQVESAKSKLGANSRTSLVLRAAAAGLIPGPRAHSRFA